MRYTEYKPPPALAPYVDCVWTIDGIGEPGDQADPIVPDGCTELVVHYGDAWQRVDSHGAVQRQPRALLVGQMTRPVHLRPPRDVGTIDRRHQIFVTVH